MEIKIKMLDKEQIRSYFLDTKYTYAEDIAIQLNDGDNIEDIVSDIVCDYFYSGEDTAIDCNMDDLSRNEFQCTIIELYHDMVMSVYNEVRELPEFKSRMEKAIGNQ